VKLVERQQIRRLEAATSRTNAGTNSLQQTARSSLKPEWNRNDSPLKAAPF
jgi:hypothetical protein